MSTKRELVRKAFHNEKTERIPVGFWFHFLEGDEFNAALERPELIQKNLEAQKRYRDSFQPDFVKIMTDGYFFLPYQLEEADTISGLKALQQLPKDHPYYEKSEAFVREVRQIYGDDTLLFYNVFSPFNHLLNGLKESGGLKTDIQKAAELLAENAAAVAGALDLIADGIIGLLNRVVGNGRADGIYLSVTNPNRSIPADIYEAYIAPSEKKILEAANRLAQDNILHICGYQGNKNILSVYRDYPESVVNWAVHAEELSLAEGKKYFGGKAVIGGFDNVKTGLLYRGSREEIEAYVEKLVSEAGQTGVIIGADCTVPSDIAIERLQWVRDKAAELSR